MSNLKSAATKTGQSSQSGTVPGAAQTFCILGEAGETLWGLSPAARLRRGLNRIGLTLEIPESELASYRDAVLVLRADAVIDTPLLGVLAEMPGLLLMGSDGSEGQRVAIHAAAGQAGEAHKLLCSHQAKSKKTIFNACSPADLDVAYWSKLRKRETPYAMILTRENVRRSEWRMFMATYKGATDFVTKHVWPRPAFYITRMIAPLGITPNMVTTLSAICVIAAYLLFERGQWELGLLAAWLMALLDTVDGKLARVTLTSSKWGDIFDHGIDLIHPPFWYLAWGFGLSVSGYPLSTSLLWGTIGVIFAGYILQRVMEGMAIKFYGIEIHIWRPIDTLFRQITARRNPNMAILTVSILFTRPDLGLIAVAVWTVICLILHFIQILQAHRAYQITGKLSSWLTVTVPSS